MEFRRGAAAIEEAAQAKGGGGFRPFVPQIKWRDDKEEKFILFLNPIESIPTVLYHDWIPVGKGEKDNGEPFTRYEDFISRKDPAIGEDYDDITDRLGVKPKERQVAVAVELEPVIETVKGRPRPVGFEVKTETYTRKGDDNSEEEVTAPVIGLVIQSAANFYGYLSSFDANQAPIQETGFQVIRRGKDANTSYDFIPFEGKPVDFAPLLDNLDGINYLGDDREELAGEVEDVEPEVAAQMIAALILDKRLDELADGERYEELVAPVQEIEQKFGPKKSNGAKRERPQRASRRQETSPDPEAVAADQTDVPDEKPATKTDRFQRLRAKIEANQA